MRFPVALKITLHTAGGNAWTADLAGAAGGVLAVGTSTSGISSIRSTSYLWKLLCSTWTAETESGCGQPRHVQPLSVSFRVPQVILKLLIEPTLRTGVERNGETHGHLRADARTGVKDAG